MNWKTTLALLVVLATLAACKSSQRSPAALSLPVYGASDVNKFQITILGDVKNPGVYWVSQSVSLANLPEIAGGWTGQGEFGISPSRALVTNSARSQGDEKIYHLKQLRRDEQEDVHFRDGDVIRFPRILF